MRSTSEAGHTKNVANFNTAAQILEEMGTLYVPSNTTILLPTLQSFATDLNRSVTTLNQKIPIRKNAVADKDLATALLIKKVTASLNYFKSLNVGQADKENIHNLALKIRGDKRKKTSNSNTSDVKKISTYQLSYDNRTANFKSFISLLASHPEYIPNEPEIQIQNLLEYHNQLISLTHSVNAATIAVITATQNRNNLLYFQENNALQRIKDIKHYLKSLGQPANPYYRALTSLRFKKF